MREPRHGLQHIAYMPFHWHFLSHSCTIRRSKPKEAIVTRSSSSHDYWRLLDLNISVGGFDHVGKLIDEGRLDEARDLFISCCRAAWQHRWMSVRQFTLRRLGEALDLERFPALLPIVDALRKEAPGAAAAFLDYLRHRSQPNCSSFVQTPQMPGPAFRPENANSFDLWQAWVTTHEPRLKQHLDRKVAQFLHPTEVISWHETNGPWGRLVMSALHHGGLDDDTLCKLVLFGLDHAEHCNLTSHLLEPAQPSIGGNHMFNWITAWLTATILFPEFRRSPVLQHTAIARLEDELSRQVMPDGSMIEGAPGYQNCCIAGASVFLSLCREHGIHLPPTILEAWRRMMHFYIGLVKPDRRLPMFGDSQDDQTYAAPMTRFYDIPSLHWLVSGGTKGSPPDYTSIAFPCIGYYVQRSDWNPDASYLCFDGGRFGQAHHHEDALNFELFACGRPMIVDVGVHSYTDHWFRHWSVLSQAHNTILIDGVGQCRWRQDRDQWYSATPLDNRWYSTPDWDLAEAEFSGPYERDIGRIVQRRRIIFHRTPPHFWCVTDFIEGQGEHNVAELFHLAEDFERVDAIDSGIIARRPQGPDFAILCPFSGPPDASTTGAFSITIHRGESDPPRGWLSPRLYEVVPAFEVHFASRAPLPLRRDFLLLPCATRLPQTMQCSLELAPSPRLQLTIGNESLALQLPER